MESTNFAGRGIPTSSHGSVDRVEHIQLHWIILTFPRVMSSMLDNVRLEVGSSPRLPAKLK